MIVIVETTFFEDKFGVSLTQGQAGSRKDANDYEIHMIIYLQVAIISQALIFVTRSHGWFFMERPSTALLCAFCVAQLISSIIAAYANWGFTQIRAISGGWIGIVWVWVRYRFLLPCATYINKIPYSEHHLVLASRPYQVRHEGYDHQVSPRAQGPPGCRDGC